MSGRVLRALVAVAVAATVVLALASGSTSHPLRHITRWWGGATTIPGEVSFEVQFGRDLDPEGPLTSMSFEFRDLRTRACLGAGVNEREVKVGANGAFAYTGPDDVEGTAVTVSGQIVDREIRGAFRLVGPSQGSGCARGGRFDSGMRSFVATCYAQCGPPPPHTNRLTTLLVPYRSIAGIALGMTRKRVLRVLGRCAPGTCARIRGSAHSITASSAELGYWRVHDGGTISAAFRRGRVVEVASSFRDVKLASGVGMGSPLAAMRAAFPRKTVRCIRPARTSARICYARRIIGRTVFVTRFDAPTRTGPVIWLEVARCKPGITGSSFPCPNDYG